MHSLIVTAQPETDAYSHAIAREVIAGIKTSGEHTFELLDLSTSGFNPTFNTADYAVFRNNATPPDDVATEQARLNRADALILIYPVFWWSMPAVMKGWIDRVFTQGWAYFDESGKDTVRLLNRLSVQTIAIGAANERTYQRRGYSQAMNTQIDQGIFGYIGARVIGTELILPLDSTSSQAGLKRACEIGSNIASAHQQSITKANSIKA
jgi:NAD(P)H dehydrogenase (quinone)